MLTVTGRLTQAQTGGAMSDIAMAGTFRLANVFSKSAAIYGRRFVPFVILTMIASIPNYIAIFTIRPTGRVDNAYAAANAVLVLLDVVTKSLASGAVMYGVVQELRGRSFSVGQSIQVALRRFLPMVGIAICSALAVVLGMVLLIVPGFILACMFYVSMPVCVAEQTGVFASMSRSSALTKGYRWQVFGTFLLLVVAGILLGGIVGAISGMIGRTALLVSTQAMAAVVGAFNGVLVGVFYYELRVDKEGIDIDKIAGVFD
jgi:uncharacterized membrane protein